jgi:mono/diheme cytochrome c family protein
MLAVHGFKLILSEAMQWRERKLCASACVKFHQVSIRLTSFCLLLLSIIALPAAGATKRAGGDVSDLPEPVKRPVKYFGDIHPVLVEHCISCHGPDKQKGGLRLDSREMALMGGSGYGPAIIPGKSAESPLILFTAHLEPDMEMPPKKPALPEATVAVLRAWIDQGALWPSKGLEPGEKVLGNQPLFFKQAATHWSFQPVVKASAESLRNGPATIDALVEAKRREKGLSASPRADAATLLKRLHFDLTGLPPSNAEMSKFVAAFATNADAAIAAKVDELLASPHYGERWGRYWLDIARYADTQDFFPTVDLRYPYAWTYRDYVIGAFNEDKPYAQFIREQIAADLLGLKENAPALAALGFLTVGPRFLRRNEEQINDRIDVVTRGLMGLTVVCARCHDHKFDPIPTADFYALYGIFNSSEIPEILPEITLTNAKVSPKVHTEYQEAKAKGDKALADLTEAQRKKATAEVMAKTAAYMDALSQLELQKKDIRKVLSETKLSETALTALQNQWAVFKKSKALTQDPVWGPLAKIANTAEAQKAAVLQGIMTSGRVPDATMDVNPLVLTALREKKPADEAALLRLYGTLASSKPLLAAFTQKDGLFDFPLKDVEKVARLSNESRKAYTDLDNARTKLEADHPGAPTRAMVMKEKAKMIKPVVFVRGDPARRGDTVDRRFLEVLDPKKTPFSEAQSGRRELAESISSPTNPLTARVWANQVWRHLLGKALVKTTGDFGLQSEPPSHPQLLDWLASAFIQRNGSTKQIVRDIVLSATYQQTSTNRPDAAMMDTDNTLLWRANRRRLDFEAMRDAMLATSGLLDPTIGGRAVNLSTVPFTGRRTIYGFVDRTNIDPLFTTFDFPSPDISNTQRTETLVPQQALFALNDGFIIEQARKLAADAKKAAAKTPGDAATAVTRELYRRVYQRAPLPEEEALGRSLLAEATTPESKPLQGSWQQGYGSADPAVARRAAFTPLPYFDAPTKRYQGARVFPDPEHGYVSVTASGGHPGAGLAKASIRRWIAPIDGEFGIEGEISIGAKVSGDGIRARVISSRTGQLGEWIVDRSNGVSARIALPKVSVKAGEILDFTVDCRETTTSDGFRWVPTIRLLVMPEKAPKGMQTVWDSQADFKAPPPPKLSPLEQMAQALIITNEFMFID